VLHFHDPRSFGIFGFRRSPSVIRTACLGGPGVPSLTRDDPSAYSPPPAFGPFRVLHQVGVGALGPVFRTYEPTRDRLVAVKVFRLDIVPEQAQALAEALSRASEAGLFHPSIVEPIAAGVEGSVAYRAEEYVAAETLDVAMRHYAPAPIEKALPFITQLAGALDFARAVGVGHGGLHPRDIFITPDEARATGFGVVDALEKVGIRAPVRRPYSAPERIAGQPWGIAADVFALAAITFELLTSRRPAGTGQEIGALPDGPHSAALHAVLARAMHEDPSSRFGSALGFAAAIDAAARGAADHADEVVAPTVIVAAGAADVDATARVDPAPHAEVAPAAVSAAQPEAAAPAVPTTRGDDAARAEVIGRAESAASAPHDDDAGTIVHAPPVSSDPRDPRDARDPRDPREPRDPRDPREPRDPRPPFADEFVDEQGADAEERRPLEAEGEARDPYPIGPAYTHVREPEFGYAAERSRSGMLPGALMLIVGLLVGFAAGYFVRDRDRGTATTEQAAAVNHAQPPTTVPATPAREYSDQAVAAPKPSASARTAEAPTPVPESAAGAPAAAAPTTGNTAAPKITVLPRRGQIVVRSTPSRAGVTVNGTWRGRTPLTLDDLAFGRYTVRVVQPGYRTAREDFSLNDSAATHAMNVRLESDRRTAAQAPAAAPRRAAPARGPDERQTFTGSLFVDSRPQGAIVLLDGKNVGRTPVRLATVPIGMHVVRIELAEHHPWYSTARIVADQENRVTASLERIQ
jgi:hypothetical protein